MIRGLPYDAEVEYLESTGTQWIDTGLPIAPNFYLDATFSIPSSIPHVLTFMGTTTQTQPYYRFWVASIQTNKTINCGLINNALSTATLPADEPHNIYVKFFDGEQLCKLDGTTIVSATNTSDSSAKAAWLAQGNLFIGRSSLNEQFNFIGKVFAVKMYDANGVLVRDLIPVRVGSGASAVGYMYDRVSRRLFGNADSGAFVLGPDKAVPILSLHRYASPSNGIALGKMGCTDLFHRITAKDYAQDGLIAMWDGIENAGWGTHDASATTWKDLIGQYDGAVNLSGLSWGEDRLHFTAGYNVSFGSVPIGDGALWLEVCVDTTSTTSFTCYVGQGGSRYIACQARDPATVIFRSYQPGSIGGLVYPGNARPHTISAGYTLDALTHYIFTDAVERKRNTYATAYRFSSTGLLMNREYNATYGSGVFDAHSVRVYSRSLTADEIARNYAIDKARFHLP